MALDVGSIHATVPVMRALRATLLWLAISILLAVSVPMFVDRPESARAVAAYSANPSPGNAAAVVREQKKMQAMRERAQLLIAAGLWSAGMILYALYRASLRQFPRRGITL